MRRSVTALAIGAALALAGSASAATPATPVQTITVVNLAGVNTKLLRRTEHALRWQANVVLRHWWHTPQIRFGPHGWLLVLVASHDWPFPPDAQGNQIGGWHSGAGAYGYPGVVAICDWDPSDVADSEASASHELMEMLVDPSAAATYAGIAKEVSDPVANIETFAPSSEVELSDFVTPAWFHRGSKRQLDWVSPTLDGLLTIRPLNSADGSWPQNSSTVA